MTWADAAQLGIEACGAALRYDMAIRKRAERGDVTTDSQQGAWAGGDDLDALYEDWITKSRRALEAWLEVAL